MDKFPYFSVPHPPEALINKSASGLVLPQDTG